ncbi:MAG TPA: 2OG-Fe(II) oxygenase [Allosphingosinicella sp.]|jgi:predicted 2-oxoglutarate/Fe(II)-dependent dioxygenase YbiX/peroxiredoxin
MSASASPRPRLLEPGDAAPWFRAPALGGSPNYVFDTAAGRPILMLFFGTAGRPETAAALAAVQAKRGLFDDENACFFGVSCDPADAADGRIAQRIPGIRFFLDHERAVSRLYGAAPAEQADHYFPHWLLLDRAMRVAGRFPLAAAAEAIAALETQRSSAAEADWAPVVKVPNVFEPALCAELVALYEAGGGTESGFMRDIDGQTRLIVDESHKRRRDHAIDDAATQKRLIARINRRLVPMVKRAFQFEPTRIERHIVACYEAGAGHFRPHRDNTTKGTAHRRFAVTINLNDGYEGGDLRFPEFGRRTYRAPVGGAIVFSCSLLHEATPVTAGRRFAYLPFLYDEAGAKLREENNAFLAEEVGTYRRA